MEDWAEIRRLHRAEGMPVRAIARKLGMGRNTVRRALAAEGPPKYQRQAKGSVADAAEPRIRELLEGWPDMPATVIAERIGWERSLTVLKVKVRELRPLFAPPDPASRTQYLPGELAQCDLWFPPADVPLGAGQSGRPPVLVMVAGYSRVMTARMIPSRQSPDLLAGHWALISGLGAVPRALVWDNESAVGQWRGGKPVLTEAMNAFRGMLGTRVIQCRPRDPEAKGLVERANGYLETSFLPGRRFTGPADFNTQLGDWLIRANTRQHRSLGCRPADRWETDKAAMLGLPPVAPVTGWRLSTRLARDSLRPGRLQRLLGASLGDRPDRRDRGWAGGGDGHLRRPPGRPPPPMPGCPPEHHRPGSRHRGGAAAPGPAADHGPARGYGRAAAGAVGL